MCNISTEESRKKALSALIGQNYLLEPNSQNNLEVIY